MNLFNDQRYITSWPVLRIIISSIWNFYLKKSKEWQSQYVGMSLVTGQFKQSNDPSAAISWWNFNRIPRSGHATNNVKSSSIVMLNKQTQLPFFQLIMYYAIKKTYILVFSKLDKGRGLRVCCLITRNYCLPKRLDDQNLVNSFVSKK